MADRDDDPFDIPLVGQAAAEEDGDDPFDIPSVGQQVNPQAVQPAPAQAQGMSPQRMFRESLGRQEALAQGLTGNWLDDLVGLVSDKGGAQLRQSAEEHPNYRAAGAAGLGTAAAMAAPMGVGAQAATGAGVSALESLGEDGDLQKAASAGGLGALGGALGGAIAKGAGYAKGAVAQALDPIEELAESGLQKAGRWGGNLMDTAGRYMGGLPGMGLSGMGRAMSRAARAPTAATPMMDVGTQQAALAGTQLAGEFAAAQLPARAQDSDTKAYAGPATFAYGLQSVLSGSYDGIPSGLPQDAEKRLTEAVVSGNMQRISATNYELSARFPAYAKRIEDELKRLNEDE